MSNHVMILALDNIVMILLIKGRGYPSFLDIALSFLKSWHRQIPPPGFLVNIIGEAQGARLASMKPLDKLSVTHCRTSFNSSWDIFYNFGAQFGFMPALRII